jgi:hypothetical protein
MADIKIENFILECDDFMSTEYCNDVIKYYQNMENAGFTASRYTFDKMENHIVSDTSFALHSTGTVNLSMTRDYSSHFLSIFWSEVYPLYSQKFSILKEAQEHKIYGIKLQKTEIGEAYHRWHNEVANTDTAGRILTFIAYLNDVEEGGETEFLYYPKRVKPKQGKIIVFPGGFTHTHRGNPNISNEKYILTGWIEY